MKTEVEEKYDAAMNVGEKAYIDSEGNLTYALDEALQYFSKALLEMVNEQQRSKGSSTKEEI